MADFVENGEADSASIFDQMLGSGTDPDATPDEPVQDGSEYFGKGELAQIQAPSEETEMDISTEILIMLSLLMIAITLGHYLKKSGHRYIQESGLTVLLGVLAGFLCQLLSMESYLTNLSKHFGNLFMILLLPPIIFESGFNMNKKPFFNNFGTVLAYSFLGTFIAIFTSSTLFYFVGQTDLSPEFSWRDSFAFGSLISATDPVSVLAIFKEMDADVNLYAIIFGESIFNDAIGIVMYETVLKMGKQDMTMSEELIAASAEFFVIFLGSIVIGAVSALLISWLLKRQSTVRKEQADFQEQRHQQVQHNHQNTSAEISMMILCPWVCYLVAEGLQMSGIVAICTNGVYLNAYAMHNITADSKRVLKLSYETVAVTAEQIVFLFLGISLFAFNHPYEQMGWGLAITTILNLNFARFLNILIVTQLVNCSRTKTKISFKMAFTMWLSGLRGAMAYALALKCATDLEIGPVILIDTLIYAFITILGVGSILNPVLSKLEVKRKLEPEVEIEQEQVPPSGCASHVKAAISRIDKKYMSPIFINMDFKESHGGAGEVFSTLPSTESWDSQQHRSSLILSRADSAESFKEPSITEEKMQSIELGPISKQQKPTGQV